MRWVTASAVASVLLLLLQAPAHAQPAEDAYVSLEALEARAEPGELIIRYKVDGRSWNWLQQHRLQPELLVVAQGRRNFEFRRPLTSPEDVLRFRLPGKVATMLEDVTVSMEGGRRRGGHRIRWMELGGSRITKLSLLVSRGPGHAGPPMPPPPPPPPAPAPVNPGWASRPEVIAACGSNFTGAQVEIACLDVMGQFRVNPLPAVRACDWAMGADDAELECLRIASGFPEDLTQVINACEQSMGPDTAELACLREAIRARFEPSKLIRTCADAMTGDELGLECIRMAMDAGRDPTQSLQACERGMGADPEELECFRRTLPR